MSSSYIYLPNPPRVWSRVQDKCTYINSNNIYSPVYIPLTKQTLPLVQANYQNQLLNKGNILQYKNNSSRLTKNQKYSQLAKGLGPSRTSVFATQSETYTNPNTTGLLRVNYKDYPFPNQLVGEPNNISGPFQYNVRNPFNCPSNTLQDGGNLVCGTYANPCTGKIIKIGKNSATVCNPTYCSDVPGSPIALCWNYKMQTWFPRQRYFMNNSTDKWPQGYKVFKSAVKPAAPILTLISNTSNTALLRWTENSNICIPISEYIIYNNNIPILRIPYNILETNINIQNGTNLLNIKSVSTNIESEYSNTITIDNI
jgi:hypothetical protein